jgi:U6 snRNA-associated Sm-like protein LSm2
MRSDLVASEILSCSINTLGGKDCTNSTGLSFERSLLGLSLQRESRPTLYLREQSLTGLAMLFFSFFKTLEGKEVTVELKNSLMIRGMLHSVDQFLNCKLSDIYVVDADKHPHLSSMKNIFIRGSVVRYVHIGASDVDIALLQDATRREYREGKAATA